MKTAAIQVIPFIDDHGDITPQFEGPTYETNGWAIYERKEDGTAEWFADTGTETHAMFIGRHLATYHSVAIEPQPWVAP